MHTVSTYYNGHTDFGQLYWLAGGLLHTMLLGRFQQYELKEMPEDMEFIQFSENDRGFLKSVFQNEQIMRFTLDDVYTEQDIDDYLTHILSNNACKNRKQYEYKVFDNNEFVGFADFEIIRKFPIGGIAEVGYLLLPDFWKKGYGIQICRMLIDICFNDLNLHKVVASCNEENIGSWKIMEKCGMTLEGRFVNHRYKHNRFMNELKYGLLNPAICTTQEPPQN